MPSATEDTVKADTNTNRDLSMAPLCDVFFAVLFSKYTFATDSTFALSITEAQEL